MRRIAAIAAVLGALGVASPASALTFTVNETGDAGDVSLADTVCDSSATAGEQCTLRAAIQEANDESGGDDIDFNVPGAGVHTIAPATNFPVLTSPVDIDGFTQPGAAPNTNPVGEPINATLLIELDGSGDPDRSSSFGLETQAGSGGTTIRGLAINRFGTGVLFRAGPVDVTGNFIGTDATGTIDEGNDFDAIFSFSGGGFEIGGVDPEDRNLLSGNGRDGVTGSTPVEVLGNYIGTEADGKSPLGNAFNGVSGFTSGNVIGGPGEAGNVIAFNGANGVELHNPNMGSPILGNRIYGNGGLGIDLGADGVTPNDDGDADAGPNEHQNFPVIKSARTGDGQTKVVAKLNSTPSSIFDLELFANKAGGREGRKPLGSFGVITDAGGDGKLRLTLGEKVRVGRRLTGTATNSNDSTSEFSKPAKVKRR
jgi:CSLREA domain-containing protein